MGSSRSQNVKSSVDYDFSRTLSLFRLGIADMGWMVCLGTYSVLVVPFKFYPFPLHFIRRISLYIFLEDGSKGTQVGAECGIAGCMDVGFFVAVCPGRGGYSRQANTVLGYAEQARRIESKRLNKTRPPASQRLPPHHTRPNQTRQDTSDHKLRAKGQIKRHEALPPIVLIRNGA